jgi:FixJ family two-component response regulator
MAMVYLVDDDPSVLNALARRLRLKGYEVEGFMSAQEFLLRQDPELPGCVILDVSMPDLDGLELQRRLMGDPASRPVIFLTGRGDISMTVRAMRAGAVDFLTKPVDDAELLDAIARALAQDARLRSERAEMAGLQARLATLTPREKEVLEHVLAQRLNKQIAGDLGTVVQTIKVHRRHMMEKLGVRTQVELNRLMAKLAPRE